MLHLAQVVKNSISERLELHLLAEETSANQWQFCHEKYISLSQQDQLNLGLLILVELGENDHIIHYENAKDWVLNLIRQYLAEGKIENVDFLQQEKVKIEKWRQELTSQSQDLTRIRLEIETRREELQELENKLSLERNNNE
ncbi:MAG: hypothetical protein IGQ45_01465 [Cyanobacterium sp. T60_A2020_053]|nr:hypothetical protein [Cyanobacterium sp. T60_A2020_053]